MPPVRPAAIARPAFTPAPGRHSSIPGLALAVAAAGLAYAVGLVVPGMSASLVAILLGVILTNAVKLPAVLLPGIDAAAKKLLRAGIVLLGLQLVLSDILSLGAPMLLVVVCTVSVGLLGTVTLGRLLGVQPGLSLLIACGFSICGAAAVAGAVGVTDPRDEAEQDTVTAVALVVLFGTLMIPLIPFAAHALGLEPAIAGLWAGASVHEIAQVVAVGSVLGPDALTSAVIVKLARVLMLAPVVAVLSVRQRCIDRVTIGEDGRESERRLPPIVPGFVVGFVAMMLVRSFVPLPPVVLTAGRTVQTGCLAAAMFGLGCGVKFRSLISVGQRPLILAALATLLVSATSFLGIALTH